MPAVTGFDAVCGGPAVRARLPARRRRAADVGQRVPPGEAGRRRQGWGECLPRQLCVRGEPRRRRSRCSATRSCPRLLGRSSRRSGGHAFLASAMARRPPTGSRRRSPADLGVVRGRPRAARCLRRSRRRSTWPPTAVRPGPHRARPGTAASRPAGRGWRCRGSLLKMRAFGFPQVKLKLERRVRGRRCAGRAARCSAAASTCGSTRTWPGTSRQALAASSGARGLGIDTIEQPIAADDLDGAGSARRRVRRRDHGRRGFDDRASLRTLISRRACTAVNVRISKCGGLVAAHARCREALDAGLVLQIGCQVGESSLLSAAHVALLSALAGRHPGVRYAEGCFGTPPAPRGSGVAGGAVRLRRPAARAARRARPRCPRRRGAPSSDGRSIRATHR